MVLHKEQSWRGAPDWLPDDTEESVVGTEWHQEAIWGLADMLREVVERRDVTWGVCEHVELAGLQRQDGHPYAPRPDVMVLRRQIPGNLAGTSLVEAGPPLFVAEIASTTTVRGDREGKRVAYAAVGIPEYLIYDPDGAILGTPIEAWRLSTPRATAYAPWTPEPDGLWHSGVLDVAFRADQPLLGVRDRDGALIESSPMARRALRATRDELRVERAARRALEEQLRQLREQRGG